MADDKAGATPPPRRKSINEELHDGLVLAAQEGRLASAWAAIDEDQRALMEPLSYYEGLIGGEG